MRIDSWAPQSILGKEQWSTEWCQERNKLAGVNLESAYTGSAAGLPSLSWMFTRCGEATPLASNFENPLHIML